MNAQALRILDKEYGVYVRAIAALAVMLSHITVGYPWYVRRLFPGELWVGVFFFFSGYGLYKSLENNPDYLQGFIRKKLKTIYLPFLLAETCSSLIFLLTNGCFSIPALVSGSLGLHLYNSVTWYVVELLVINLLFYLSSLYLSCKCKKHVNILLFWFGIFGGFLAFGVVFDIATCWYISTSAFVLGVAAVKYESKFASVITAKRAFMWPIAFIVGFCILCYVSHGEMSRVSININYVITAITMLLVPVFVMACAVTLQLQNIELGGAKFLSFIGTASYEIYLWHMPVFILGGLFIGDSLLRIIFTVLTTSIIAITLNYNKILK